MYKEEQTGFEFRKKIWDKNLQSTVEALHATALVSDQL